MCEYEGGKDGIIPAYAGSTLVSGLPANVDRDHPRVCGEHRDTGSCHDCATGSSPRMRGARSEAQEAVADAGIIPAYAGSTSRRALRTQPMRDHPRVCGEHRLLTALHLFQSGSSPRMRGALLNKSLFEHILGIIPAYAGSTAHIVVQIARRRDHPRVCGEHCEPAREAFDAMGSSPRMRGAPDFVIVKATQGGIIPAYAGST